MKNTYRIKEDPPRRISFLGGIRASLWAGISPVLMARALYKRAINLPRRKVRAPNKIRAASMPHSSTPSSKTTHTLKYITPEICPNTSNKMGSTTMLPVW